MEDSSLEMPEHTKIRRSFTVFLRGVLLPRRIPDRDFSAYNDLLEVDTMLAEKVRDWTKAWEKEGLRKGIHRGRREGMEKGRQEGLRKALARTAMRMIEKGMDLETISELTGLDIDKVRDMSQNPDRYRAETDG
ncbi:hypothetical protein [Dethiosulfovibrio peptidovorans]|uniref:hypothetical protein n=1 Tax=Dethiosulfovibrio peptidovorans TaxID=47055 RepID=UPI00019E5762|nr:hypothetical protein [Dethiosulfovibrio peptidovorans]